MQITSNACVNSYPKNSNPKAPPPQVALTIFTLLLYINLWTRFISSAARVGGVRVMPAVRISALTLCHFSFSMANERSVCGPDFTTN